MVVLQAPYNLSMGDRVARYTFECKAKQILIHFSYSSHEKLQIHVISILPVGMSGTYGINLARCEVFFSISGDAMKSLKHLFESNSSGLTLTIASRRFSCILFLASVLMEDTRQNILPTTALLTGVIRQVRAMVVSSLNALY
jgi:hypothetical protein